MSNILRFIQKRIASWRSSVAAWFSPTAVALDLRIEEVVETAPAPAMVVETAPAPVIPLERVRRSASLRPGDTRWHFKGAILDRLDEYFSCIRRLRRHDPGAYERMVQIGFTVPADAWVNPESAKHQITPDKLVAFGGITMPAGEKIDDQVLPLVIYFTKMTQPSFVQSFQGTVYSVSCMYDDRRREHAWRSRLTAVGNCHVGVDADGSVTLLKQCYRSFETFKVGKRRTSITRETRHWSYPAFLYNEERTTPQQVEEAAANLFKLALLTHIDSTSKIVVRAHYGGTVAAFGIELQRAKRFFADRELDSEGKKRRIFHSVVEHDRRLASGRTTTVRSHFRGARKFEWNGYGITIVLPKNSDVLAFAAPGRYQDEIAADAQPAYMDEKAVGGALAEVLET